MSNSEFGEPGHQPNPIEIQQHLGGVDYPCSKQELVEHAREDQAPDEVVSMLQRIEDRDYNSPTDVSEAVGDLE